MTWSWFLPVVFFLWSLEGKDHVTAHEIRPRTIRPRTPRPSHDPPYSAMIYKMTSVYLSFSLINELALSDANYIDFHLSDEIWWFSIYYVNFIIIEIWYSLATMAAFHLHSIQFLIYLLVCNHSLSRSSKQNISIESLSTSIE